MAGPMRLLRMHVQRALTGIYPLGAIRRVPQYQHDLSSAHYVKVLRTLAIALLCTHRRLGMLLILHLQAPDAQRVQRYQILQLLHGFRRVLGNVEIN